MVSRKASHNKQHLETWMTTAAVTMSEEQAALGWNGLKLIKTVQLIEVFVYPPCRHIFLFCRANYWKMMLRDCVVLCCCHMMDCLKRAESMRKYLRNIHVHSLWVCTRTLRTNFIRKTLVQSPPIFDNWKICHLNFSLRWRYCSICDVFKCANGYRFSDLLGSNYNDRQDVCL